MSTIGSQLRDPRVVSFSAFTFNLESGELMLRGRKLVLQEQHARVLAALLQQPGRVLSREDLRDIVWPGVVFVDYQHAINKAISQLRKVLNDDSRMPRFIETIPKRGYRFCNEIYVAEVASPEEATASKQPMEAAVSAVDPSPAAAPGETEPHRAALWPGPRTAFVSWVAAIATLLLATTVGSGGILWLRDTLKPKGVAVAPVSIGIPPFDVEGEGAEPLAENFRLDLTDALAQIPAVRIHAAHAFTGAPRDEESVRAMARAQKLDVMIFGTFQLKDHICSLDLELVRTSDTSHLALLHYTGTAQQLRSVRDNIQRDVFTKLKLSRISTPPTPDSTLPQAYAVYLEGRQHLTERTDDALRKASKEFRTAISLDPKFADAYAGLASVTMLQADRDLPEGTYPEAKQLAVRALEIDASQAQAHAVLGCIAMSHEWKRANAEKELTTAVQLDPGEAVYHVWLAALLGLEGRFEEGFRQVDLAREDDPYWPPVYQTEIAIAASSAQTARMLSAAQRLIALTPSWPNAHDQMAWAYWYSHRYPEAISEWRQMAVLAHDKLREEVEKRGLAEFEKGGVAAYAQLRLRNLGGNTGFAYRSKSLQEAEWAAYASDAEHAIAELAAMVDGHDPSAVDAVVDPAFFGLRDNPRYQALVARISASGV